MLFHSLEFFAFFAAFLIGLALFRGSARIAYVTLSSYAFYAWWDPRYMVVLLALTLYGHYFANRVRLDRRSLAVVIAVGFLPLAIFKYTGFAISNWNQLGLPAIAFQPDWRLPLGISFVTFTIIALIVDAQSGKVKIERDPWKTALYVAFFPHLIAGPILRAKKVLPQLARIGLRLGALRFSVLLFTVGALKKVAIADQLAPFVDNAYRHADTLTQAQAIVAFYGFLVQIYCDFSGYTDMAFALAFALGIRFPLNFNSPYSAASFREFWRRWHISLSQWLRDYLYVPLGGSRGPFAQTLAALIVTMLLGGLWHGAAWTFVIWGGIHGLLLAAEHVNRRFGLLPPLPRPLGVLLVVHVVAVLWVFFRAPNVSTALEILARLVSPDGEGSFADYLFPIVLICVVLVLHRWDNAIWLRWLSRKMPMAVLGPAAFVAVLVCAAISATNPSAFIYFDF